MSDTSNSNALKRGKLIVALIALLGMIGPFSVDAYVPAFGAIGAELKATAYQVQQSLSVWFLGMGIMSLWHGALSDAIGRRPVILGTLSVFMLATLGCALASDIQTLTAFRLLQGLTAGAGHIVGRAILRDLFDGPQAQRMQSLQVMVFSLAPVIAPLIGGSIVSVASWRWIFVFIIAFAVLAFVMTWNLLPETHPPAARTAFRPRALFENYRSVFWQAEFQWLAACNAFGFGAIMIYVVFSPALIIDHLKLTPNHFVWVYGPMVVGFVTGAFVSGKLAGKTPRKTQLRLGLCILVFAALVNAILQAFVKPGLPVAILHLPIANFGIALVAPILQLRLLDRFPTLRGTAASLLAFTQVMLVTVLSSFFVPLITRTSLHMALGMLSFSLIAVFAYWQLERKFGRTTL